MESKLDTINYQILTCLNKNGRMNASEIAERVNLSVSAVIERIKKLENDGTIIGYTAQIDPSKLNKDVVAIVTIAIDHPKYNLSFEQTIAQNDNVTECMYMAGDTDYLLKIVTDNTKTLEMTINEIKSIEGVAKTRTSLVLATPKNDYSILLKAKK